MFVFSSSVRRVSLLGIAIALQAFSPLRAAEPEANQLAPLESARSEPRQVARHATGMVTAAHPLASEAGVEILQAGGNAIDAAIATALAISVLEPYSAGIGGGGFLLVYDADSREVRSLDFRERAPIAATRDMYLDANGEATDKSRTGHLAVAVPGTVAGLYEAHREYGELDWETVVQPAIELAASGFPVSERFARSVNWRAERLFANPAARDAFSRDGEQYELGDRLVQPDLAATLTRIAADPDDFYRGETARAIAADMAEFGGLLTVEDLEQYEPIWRDPVCGYFQPADERFEICAMAPPSSGGVHLLQMLQLLEPLGWASLDPGQRRHLTIEAMKIAYADRAEYLGDPDFVDVPTEALLSPDYLDARRAEIEPDRARSAEEVQPANPQFLSNLRPESPETSHLTVVDRDRNAVSLTFTVNGGFGAGVVAAGTGIVLNNEMDDFAIAPGVPNIYGLIGSEANAIAARKTPLSSMTPTIVTDGAGNLRLAVGSPGGSTIITTVFQVTLEVLARDLDVAAALAAPRVHHQWQPDRLRLEESFNPAIVRALENLGHDPTVRGRWGNANAIEVVPATNPSDETELVGAVDPRGAGAASGY
ncbi:MAG: gamma-glutamyltransferase [Geitlerinemataceae cyanobacterium]